MTASLVVSTYNWKEALALTLRTAAAQRVLPGEVIVADDGSAADTADLVRAVAQGFPVPLRHVWQDDRGFRLAQIRNRAIAAARHPYIIQVDGDLLLHPRFVQDHLAVARRGRFVRGSRALLSPGSTAALLAGRPGRPGPGEPGLGKRWAALRLPWLGRALLGYGAGDLRGHYLAYWRDDAVRVNGYDERFEGWGREDDEFAQRLRNAGVRKRRLRFAAVVYHLHHAPRPRPELARNDALLAETARTGRVRCEAGLDRHLRAAPA
jgi:glycosyltransferase involved in cell wall biosynthesis